MPEITWPLIKPEDTWTLWALIAVIVALSIYAEQTWSWAAKISGPVFGLLVAMTLSTCQIAPTDAPPYDVATTFLAPMAIPLLLLRANIVKIARETGMMFVAVHLATLGTVIGAFLAAFLMRNYLPRIAELSGLMTASYVGGMINFLAVKGTYQISDRLTAPMLVADNIVMAAMFLALQMMAGSRFFRRHFPHPHSVAADNAEIQEVSAAFWRRKEISLLDLAKAVAVAITLTACAHFLGGMAKAHFAEGSMPHSLLGNIYVMTTFVSVLAATLFPRQLEEMPGAQELGSYLLLVFLVVIGFPADLVTVLRDAPSMFVFCLIIAVPNIVVTMVLGKLLRLNLEDLLLASNATLGGPPTAAAMAISRGWPKLALPALLIGLWGYTIGTIVGVAVANTLINWLPHN